MRVLGLIILLDYTLYLVVLRDYILTCTGDSEHSTEFTVPHCREDTLLHETSRNNDMFIIFKNNDIIYCYSEHSTELTLLHCRPGTLLHETSTKNVMSIIFNENDII